MSIVKAYELVPYFDYAMHQATGKVICRMVATENMESHRTP